MKLPGCPVSTMLASYKRLLKAEADQAAGDDGDGDGDGDEADAADTTAQAPIPAPADVAAAPSGATVAALGDDPGHRFDAMVEFNPAIQAAIRRWLTDMRPSLMDSYENYQYLRSQMWPAFQAQGLPEPLLFGILAKESNGRVHSISRAGAAGPMQFMPATGRVYGIGPDGSGFDTRFDAQAAAQAAASYLSQRLGELGNSVELSLAAYNGGEGRALRVYQASGGLSFWNAGIYNQFPAETRDYVPMVIAAAWLYLHPKQYGLNFPRYDTRPASITLQAPTTLYQMTICLGSGRSRDGFMRVLRNLNPRYQADTPLLAGTSLRGTEEVARLYQRWCLAGPRAELAQALVNADAATAIVRTGPIEPLPVAAADPPPRKPGKLKTHRVERGETLNRIAERHGCNLRELARANRLRAPHYTVHAGQRLKLQGCDR
jgi:membrane-bound lytic murein transglycosylase D